MHMMESALHIKTAPAVEVDMRPIQRGMCTLKSTNVSTINFCAYHSTCNAINPSIGPPLFVPVLQPDPFTDCTCCDVSPNTQSCLQHYQCSQIRKMKLDDIDPCIAVCLFCKCEEDFHDLCARQEEADSDQLPLPCAMARSNSSLDLSMHRSISQPDKPYYCGHRTVASTLSTCVSE